MSIHTSAYTYIFYTISIQFKNNHENATSNIPGMQNKAKTERIKILLVGLLITSRVNSEELHNQTNKCIKRNKKTSSLERERTQKLC